VGCGDLEQMPHWMKWISSVSSGGKFRAITLETQYWRLGIQLAFISTSGAAPDYSVGID